MAVGVCVVVVSCFRSHIPRAVSLTCAHNSAAPTPTALRSPENLWTAQSCAPKRCGHARSATSPGSTFGRPSWCVTPLPSRPHLNLPSALVGTACCIWALFNMLPLALVLHLSHAARGVNPVDGWLLYLRDETRECV